MCNHHFPSCQTESHSSFRGIVLFALILLGCALPSSAETQIWTLKMPMYPLPLGQTVYVNVADLVNSEEGGLVEIQFIDSAGATVAELETHLSKNRAVRLSLNADQDNLPPNQPLLWVRAVVKVTKDLTSDLKTGVSIIQVDPITLDLEPWCSRVGPASDNNNETEFNCPAWEVNEITM